VLEIYRRLFGPADPPPKPLYDILILGLSGAGKSAILKVLLGEPLEDLAPTKGMCLLTSNDSGLITTLRCRLHHQADRHAARCGVQREGNKRYEHLEGLTVALFLFAARSHA
jgi:Fe-S cluster assembly ATPase SufC